LKTKPLAFVPQSSPDLPMCQGGGVQAIADCTNRSRAFPRNNISLCQAVKPEI
jgi:hypothetical protein